jgi:hypothetical protein
VVATAGCGGSSPKPQAENSARKLSAEARQAAGPLVRLESLVRAKNARGLCSRVYVFDGEAGTDCPRALRPLLRADFTLAIRSVRVKGVTAVANADVSFKDRNGTQHQRDTFQLRKTRRGWRIVYIS